MRPRARLKCWLTLLALISLRSPVYMLKDAHRSGEQPSADGHERGIARDGDKTFVWALQDGLLKVCRFRR